MIVDDVSIEGSSATTPLSVSGSPGNVSCHGGSDGSVDISVSGGVTPYVYSWSNGAATEDITSVSAGSYSVTVTDANGSTVSSSFAVTEPSALSLSVSSSDISCNGGSDGSASVSVSGGTSPYFYSWSNGGSGQSISSLSAGSYSVTVTDDNGCTASASASIAEPSALSLSTSSSDVSCNGGSDGSVSTSVSGGTAPYTYSWSNGGSGQSISSISAGSYSVTVTDDNGCSASASASIAEPSSLSLSMSSTKTSGNGNSDGSASVSVSGGTSPYSYVWSNGDSSSSISGLNAGTYHVTVTDQNNCQNADSIDVQEGNCSYTWDGSEGSDWLNGDNWSCGSVPTSSDSVTIPLNVPNMPVISDSAKSGVITIDSGATVSFAGSGSPSLEIHGDLISNGSIDYSAGEVKMKGDTKQIITGPASIKVHNLIIDNDASSFPQIVLETNVDVANELSLLDGNIQTGGDTISLTNTSASSLTNYSAQSHIVGYFKRHITKNRSEYVFPVGEGTDSTYYQGAIINRNMSDVNWIVSKFEPSLARYDSSKLDASTGEFDYTRLWEEGMWIFEPDQQPSFPGMYDVKLWIDNIDGLTDNLFGIVKRPKGAGASAWGTGNCMLNNPGGKGRLKAHGYALSMMCQSFSEQTGGDGDGTSQPINLLNFDAKLKDGQVNLNWSTASEVNNDYFTVQRSQNGHEWEDIAKVDGAGNSSSRISYSEVDNDPYEGISYYRLKQTDLNGDATHTGIVTIHNKGYEETDVTVYPNPSRGQFNIEMRSNAESIHMSLYNINGELLFKKQLGSSNGHYEGSFNFQDQLSSGVYFLRMTPTDGENSYTEKIRINK